jgi:hypothetical protein
LRVDVSNVGQADALTVSCTPTMSGTGTATLTSSPAAQTIPAQSMRTFLWTVHTTAAGTLSFSVAASGTDALSTTTISANASAGPATVQIPAALSADIVATPATANTGQPINVKVTVKNNAWSRP